MRSLFVSIIFVFQFLVSNVLSQDSGSSDRLTHLRESWQRSIESARKPIDAKYESELEKLLANYTKYGQLKEAIRVQEELDLIKENVAGFSFVGKWRLTIAATKYSEVRTITEDSLVAANGTLLPYKVQGSYVKIKYSDDHWGRFKINPKNFNVLKGEGRQRIEVVYSRISE